MEKESNKKQTAVEWLIEGIECRGLITKELREEFKQAKQMEKEQIKDAVQSCNFIGGATDIEAEDYYNETYGKTFIDLVSDEESKVHEVVRKLKEKKYKEVTNESK
jgi:gas vesicle protein